MFLFPAVIIYVLSVAFFGLLYMSIGLIKLVLKLVWKFTAWSVTGIWNSVIIRNMKISKGSM